MRNRVKPLCTRLWGSMCVRSTLWLCVACVASSWWWRFPQGYAGAGPKENGATRAPSWPQARARLQHAPAFLIPIGRGGNHPVAPAHAGGELLGRLAGGELAGVVPLRAHAIGKG